MKLKKTLMGISGAVIVGIFVYAMGPSGTREHMARQFCEKLGFKGTTYKTYEGNPCLKILAPRDEKK